MQRITRSLLFVGLLIAFECRCQPIKGDPGKDKIDSIISQMSLEEKIAMVHANTLFSSAGVQRLNIPDLICDDGPLGVREDLKEGWASANLTTDSATFFPNGSALAATWNPALAYRYGHALGEEARARGKHIILAPAINITRTPLNGRTYEYLSEDPLLNARLSVQAIKGIQSNNVAACVKHFAVNNQEVERGRVNVEIDERALREIYLPAFHASIVEGDAWTVMSAYNKVRGQYCAENDYLLNKILKGEWKFKGAVVSDWGGTHSTVESANNGLDIEMGSGEQYDKYYFATPLLDAVKSGKVPMSVIDDKIRRILWVIYNTSLSENKAPGKLNTPEHSKAVYDIASESIVLLKNERSMLPLNLQSVKSIAVIGDNAIHKFQSGGFGAGVKARYEITALEGLKSKLPKSVRVLFAQGYSGVYRPGDVQVNIETPPADAAMIKEAVDVAAKSEVAIVFVGGNRNYESESRDRKDLSLPFGEQALVDAVTKVNKNTIVVVVGGAPYDISSIKKNNHTIVWSWFNGSENGNALADVLLGKVNPSGKMPFTFPASLNSAPGHADGTTGYPGVNLTVNYKEGIFVGYRWYDKKNVEVLYPFGYGLSYTKFALSEFKTDRKTYASTDTVVINFKLKNTGKYDGKETVQVYVGKADSKVERAPKELKAFQKVLVNAGGVTEVSLSVPVSQLAYYDVSIRGWIVEPGPYSVFAGFSSQDIKATTSITVK